MFLDPRVQDIEHPEARMTLDVGSHLRAVRTMYGLSQRELAKRAGVTNGLISLIEQNRVSPSVSSLKKVLDGIPMSLAEFFTLDLTASPQVFFQGDELTDLGDRSVSLRLVAARRPNRAMSVMHERYAPGADTGADMLRHEGEEGGVVVRGRIELTVGGETRVLAPGDAYYFTSAIPHRFRNVGAEPCEIISASTPPTF
jgi:transcriptional regulator with XRE-family HTH domain